MRKTVLLVASSVAMVLLFSVAVLADVVMGTDADDTLTGTNTPDWLYGYGGSDTLNGRGADDELYGGTGIDTLKGGPAADLLNGEGGADVLDGGLGDDELRGGDGKDRLKGNDGDDRLYDRGGDTLRDSFVCGAGTDTVKADARDTVNADCENVNLDGGEELLPDLGMAQVQDLQIENRVDGSRWLLFSSNIVNVGAGDFEVTGRRPPGGSVSDMTTTQRIYDSAGDYRDRSTDATFFYSGDGHEHWHVRKLEDYELFSAGGGSALAASPKNGFCFYDNERYGSTVDPVYRSEGCAPNDPDALSVTMGLSRGWGDRYGPQQYGQGINVTNLADGEYRLVQTADGANWFLESNETNNSTWTDIEISGSTVTVLQHGPSAAPLGG